MVHGNCLKILFPVFMSVKHFSVDAEVNMWYNTEKMRGKTLKTVYLYTDGACSGNPGPGGWCALLRYGNVEKTVSGGNAHTTNNRMELTAVIEGLRALKESCKVICITDSKYVCDAVNKNWISSWQKKGWKKSDGKPVLNPELWLEFVKLVTLHDVTFEWIKGHNGYPENEYCDKVAVKESLRFKNI